MCRTRMIYSIFQLTLVPLAILAVETPVPERFLAPRDFNPHPLTDVRRPSPTYKRLNIPGPEEIYSHYNREPAYKGQEYNQYAPQQLQQRLAEYSGHQQDQLLSVAAEHVQQTEYNHGAHLSTQQEYHNNADDNTHHDHSYDEHIPKQYAFSYSVLDHHSGDDFSHAQQHDGHSTEGQYRVKLPDGRVQVVRYTADKGGYRAKVSYEPAAVDTSAEIQTHPTPSYYKSYPAAVANQYTPTVTPTPDYHTETHATINTTPYPYTTAYANNQQQFIVTTEHPAYNFQPTIIPPTYSSGQNHFSSGHEPRVHVRYNGGASETTIQPSQVVFEQHHVYKRDHR